MSKTYDKSLAMKNDRVLKLAKVGYAGLGAFTFFWAFACASPPPYRVVKKTQADGVLAIVDPNNPETRQLIDQEMRNHCRGNYQVIEEGEVVIGTDQIESNSQSTYGSQSTQAAGNAFGGRRWASGNSVANTVGAQHTNSQAVTSTRDAKEYQLRYQCTPGAAPAPGVVPPPAPGTPPQSGAPAPGVAPMRTGEIHTLRIRVL